MKTSAALQKQTLSSDPVNEICAFVHARTGVQLGEKQRPMVVSRLQKRLLELSLHSMEEYLEYVRANQETESPKLIGLLTTHHTYFFREFIHFEHLKTHALPAMAAELKQRPDRKLRVWSAAGSRGQEAYSLAMFLSLHLKAIDPTLDFEILASDVDPESVEIGKNGVYSYDEIKEAPLALLGEHWTRGTGQISNYVKAKASLRSKIRFETMNLLELPAHTGPKFDLIFCRNVFIYFNAAQIKKSTNDLLKRLSPQGTLFLGISETLNGLDLPVRLLGPSIYRHPEARPPASAAPATRPVLREAPPAPRPFRVLCVDDSSSILSLMKQILKKEEGFEIVATAKDGLEAAKAIAAGGIDLVTLDIHMPNLDGVEYLRKHYRPGHPPVVMVTSVSRSNSDLALEALRLGAVDYVEKPSLSNLPEKADELRTKLRCAADAAGTGASVNTLTLDRSFQTPEAIQDPAQKLRLFFFPFSLKSRFLQVFRTFSGPQPPIALWIEGASEALPRIAERLSQDCGVPIECRDDPKGELAPGKVYLFDLERSFDGFRELHQGKATSILVFGETTKKAADRILSWSGAQLLIEDRGPGKPHPLAEAASNVVPLTSFGYESSAFFAKIKK